VSPSRDSLLRALPAVDRLVAAAGEAGAPAAGTSHAELVAAARTVLDALRGAIGRGEAGEAWSSTAG
jgi:hypothetical protein